MLKRFSTAFGMARHLAGKAPARSSRKAVRVADSGTPETATSTAALNNGPGAR